MPRNTVRGKQVRRRTSRRAARDPSPPQPDQHSFEWSSESGSDFDPDDADDDKLDSDNEIIHDGAALHKDDGNLDDATYNSYLDQEALEIEQGAGDFDYDSDIDSLIDDEEDVLHLGPVNDPDMLHDGNLNPPEYYCRGIQMLKLDDY